MYKRGLVLLVGMLCADSLDGLMAQERLAERCAQPLIMQRTYLAEYFSGIFNEKGYGDYALEHLLDFVHFAARTNQSPSFLARTFDLFQVRIKEGITCTNPYVVLDLLKLLRTVLPDLYEKGIKDRSAAVAACMKSALLRDFDALKEDPDLFLQALAEEVVDEVMKHNQSSIEQSVVRLIESILDRIVWSPHEQVGAWTVAQLISHELYELYSERIIQHVDELHRLYWSLTHRFILFLETVGDHLSTETYAMMKRDIATEASPLCVSAIQHIAVPIKDRHEWLKDAIFAAEVRARVAHAESLLSQN